MKKIQIESNETAKTLFEKFAEISGNFAIETIKKLDKGLLVPKLQDHSQATFCKKITKEEGLLDFAKTAEELYHLYQGFTPWPGVFTFYKEKKLLIEKCFYVSELPPVFDHPPQGGGQGGSSEIGTVIQEGDEIGIVCGKGILTLSQVKLEGKKSQSIKAFLNGQREFISFVLT